AGRPNISDGRRPLAALLPVDGAAHSLAAGPPGPVSGPAVRMPGERGGGALYGCLRTGHVRRDFWRHARGWRPVARRLEYPAPRGLGVLGGTAGRPVADRAARVACGERQLG